MNSRILTVTILAAGMAVAQGPRGPQAGASRTMRGTGIDMAKQAVVEGNITAVHVAYGAQYPSIEVDKKTIKVAPVWWMLENDFELKEGMAVKVTAAPSLAASDPYLYAVDLTNQANNSKITLRDAQGVPLWTGGRNGGGQGNAGGNGLHTGTPLAAVSIATATGVIADITMGAGVQHPSLVLKTQEGSLLTIELGPERILLASDFEITKGETVTVKYAKAACEQEELIALSITNAAGGTLVLRGDDGFPAWNR